MTMFTDLYREMGVKLTTDKMGLYNGMCGALAKMTTEVVISDNEEIFNLDWKAQKELIKENFYKVFPYMKEGK